MELRKESDKLEFNLARTEALLENAKKENEKCKTHYKTIAKERTEAFASYDPAAQGILDQKKKKAGWAIAAFGFLALEMLTLKACYNQTQELEKSLNESKSNRKYFQAITRCYDQIQELEKSLNGSNRKYSQAITQNQGLENQELERKNKDLMDTEAKQKDEMSKALKLINTDLLVAGYSPAKASESLSGDTKSFSINQNGFSFADYKGEIPILEVYSDSPEGGVASCSVKAEVLMLERENNSLCFQFKLYNQEHPIQSKCLLKLGTTLDSNYKNIENKFNVKLGNLTVGDMKDTKDYSGSQPIPSQNLIGCQNDTDFSIYNNAGIKLNFGASAGCTFSNIEDKFYNDNYELGTNIKYSADLSKKVNISVKALKEACMLNKSKYFFLDKINKNELSTLLDLKLNKNLKIDLFNKLENEINEKELYKKTNGLQASFKEFWAKLISTNIPAEETKQTTINLGKQLKNSGIELYFTSLTSPKSWKNETLFGLNWNIGSGKKNDNFDHPYSLSPRQFKDNNLSFEEIVEDLDTIQKQTRWLNTNIRYKKGYLWPPRTPREVYMDRGGDCDELSGLATFLAANHGYKAYTLAAYPGTAVPHAASLIANKRGELFLINDVGVPEKVNCDPNLPLIEKGKKALSQFNEYFNINENESVGIDLWQWQLSKSGEWWEQKEGDLDFISGYKEEKRTYIKKETGLKTLIGNEF